MIIVSVKIEKLDLTYVQCTRSASLKSLISKFEIDKSGTSLI